MWDTYSSGEDKAPRANVGRLIKWGILASMGIMIFMVASNQAVNLFLNLTEFGSVYSKTLYYSITSGLVLAAIALVRVNVASRHSIVWYLISLIVRFVKRSSDFEAPSKPFRYSDFHMSPLSFGLWQMTKVVILAPLFANIGFGMALAYMAEGNDIGVSSIGSILSIPFASVPANDDGSFAQQNVIPAIPALALLMPALIGAVGARLLIYVGASGTANIVSQYMADAAEHKPKFLSYISTVEVIVGAAIFWAGITMFFSEDIDYNTKYVIVGALALGAALIFYGFLDKRRARVIIFPPKRHAYLRLVTVAAVIAIVGSIVAVNTSIAEAKKVEWRGPYITQEVAVNRNIAELDQINVVNYDVKPPSVAPADIPEIVSANSDTLHNIRLWDQEAASLKLKPELGQRNDIVFADTDMLRFSGTMYWTGDTTPKLPDTVARGTEWFNQHLVYTHADPGFKMLEADTGNVVNEDKFFPQERIYYGESGDEGLFSRSWAAYPVGRTTSDEVSQFFYNGTGGIDVPQTISWMFEPNFMLSYPDTPIHIMRYKDIHDRMDMLYPYFVYDFAFGGDDTVAPIFHKVGVVPVTDGKNTYWLMPMIAALDTSHVPWGSPFMLKLVGYSLIDTYNGSVKVIVTGKDEFSNIFYDQYKGLGATRDVPQWLDKQIRYPEEMFIWKISKFNRYHVTDPKTFIEARQFYDIPKDGSNDIPPYYIITKPQGFGSPQFVGFQSLELSGSTTKNLVGYMIVENDLPTLGKMTFYSVPLDSATKLIGPSAAREALEKDKEYKNVKTLLQGNPRVGENILYRIGDQEVYFIPVYTANTSGGVVSQIGTIAVVGASVTGTFNVGLGDDPVQAFENYLLKAAGQQPTAVSPGQAGGATSANGTATIGGNNNNNTSTAGGAPVAQASDVQDRINAIERAFSDTGVQIVKPTAISAPLEFREAGVTYKAETDFGLAKDAITKFVQDNPPDNGRVYEWQVGNTVNFGVLKVSGGIVENHYISIEVR
ncbi:MAG TPA: UPF0182 family protein [Nitrososphaera sp.]|nr:UPF0182 family protein [Nitrososphaera sp.]